MFLSKLTLNTRNRDVRRDLANPYELHRTLTRVWDNAPNSLFRLEDDVLLAQTTEAPGWEKLGPSYLRGEALTRRLNLEDHLRLTQPLRFRLRGNPSIARLAGHRPTDGKRRTKRHPLLEVEDQLRWLQRQGERNGFEVVGAMVSDSGFLRLYNPTQERRMLLFQATFDGHLRVTDTERFRQAFRLGVGHGKSWGLGMLSL